MACFADIDVSQGSLATYARCDGIFNIHLIANLRRTLSVKFCKNRLRFDRIVIMSLWPTFLAHPVHVVLDWREWRCGCSGELDVTGQSTLSLDVLHRRPSTCWRHHQLTAAHRPALLYLAAAAARAGAAAGWGWGQEQSEVIRQPVSRRRRRDDVVVRRLISMLKVTQQGATPDLADKPPPAAGGAIWRWEQSSEVVREPESRWRRDDVVWRSSWCGDWVVIKTSKTNSGRDVLHPVHDVGQLIEILRWSSTALRRLLVCSRLRQ